MRTLPSFFELPPHLPLQSFLCRSKHNTTSQRSVLPELLCYGCNRALHSVEKGCSPYTQSLPNSLWSDWRHLNEITSLWICLSKLPLKHPKHHKSQRRGNPSHEVLMKKALPATTEAPGLPSELPMASVSLCLGCLSAGAQITLSLTRIALDTPSTMTVLKSCWGCSRSCTALHPDRPWLMNPDREVMWQNRKGKEK